MVDYYLAKLLRESLKRSRAHKLIEKDLEPTAELDLPYNGR